MSILRPVFIVAGVGNGTGTGAAAARLFAKKGYSVALVARGKDSLNRLAEEIKKGGGEATPFAMPSYTSADFNTVFSSIHSHFPSSSFSVRAALFNVGLSIFKPFLDIKPEEVQQCLETNVLAGFAFSREAILSFKRNDLDAAGTRGTLIFTGATASTRGNVSTSAMAAAKSANRALSQSLAKEFGKDGIHVAHAIIDGRIMTGDALARNPGQPPSGLSPESIAQSYLHLANQQSSAWTWELDLRPADEKW